MGIRRNLLRGTDQTGDDPKAQGVPWTNTHTGRWHTGQFFVVQEEGARPGGEEFDTLSVMAVDPTTGNYLARSFENHGFYRHDDLTVTATAGRSPVTMNEPRSPSATTTAPNTRLGSSPLSARWPGSVNREVSAMARWQGDDMTEAVHVILLPLDAEIVRRRLQTDDFTLERVIAGTGHSLHFGPEFPGGALVLYRRFLEAIDDDPVVDGSFVVVDPATGEVVGQVGTMGPSCEEKIEIGYGMNRAAQGRGVATAAVRALVALLASTGSVARVIARTAVANPASGRVLEKNGFEVIGRQDSDEGELLVWAHDVRAGS